ncbi:hypothetical protein V8G54_004602 [Vigna mungo]|uniref:Uncharacterized protein n=1 Tax=Vigna mungo TaxID=3915 RepID=A0AAQ3SEC7_VIGMU
MANCTELVKLIVITFLLDIRLTKPQFSSFYLMDFLNQSRNILRPVFIDGILPVFTRGDILVDMFPRNQATNISQKYIKALIIGCKGGRANNTIRYPTEPKKFNLLDYLYCHNIILASKHPLMNQRFHAEDKQLYVHVA